jgi:hypothetical protein
VSLAIIWRGRGRRGRQHAGRRTDTGANTSADRRTGTAADRSASRRTGARADRRSAEGAVGRVVGIARRQPDQQSACGRYHQNLCHRGSFVADRLKITQARTRRSVDACWSKRPAMAIVAAIADLTLEID